MAIIRKNSIKTRLLLVIFLGILIPILVLIWVSSAEFKEQSEIIAKKQAISLADHYSKSIEGSLNDLFTSVNVFADIQTSTITKDGYTAFSDSQLHLSQIEILKRHEQAIAFYTIYLPGHILDPSTDSINSGLALIGDIHYKNKFLPLVFWDYSFKTNVPDTLKKGNGYMLIPPYFDVYESDSLLMVSYGHAITYQNEIIGMVGADISIDWVQDFISSSKLFNNTAEIAIVSNRGIINAYNKNKSRVGKKMKDFLPTYEHERVSLFSNVPGNTREGDYYVFYEPIKFSKLKDTWHLRIAVPESEILGEAYRALLIRIIIAVLIMSVSLTITYYHFNKITGRIMKLAAAAKRMAKGNLFIDFETEGNDEITALGNSLHAIITRFSDIIKGLKITMTQLHESGATLSNTAIKLSEGASEQASSTQEVSASMEQMNANIEQNAENSKAADLIAKKSSKEIELSSKNVKATAGSMGDIAKKTSIIGDIAFQVNILALNAAVEAARAGVHGKGFSVVANEVGKLADRSKLAAAEIDELTNKSFVIAKKSGQSLEEIVPEIQKTAVLVQDITNASIEQKAGSEQINNAIQQLNNVTQQNASSSEQLATNVESLTMLADKLNKLIAFFKLEASHKRSEQVKTKKTEKSRTDIKPEIKAEPVVKEKPEEKKIEEVQKQKKQSSEGFELKLGDDEIKDDGFEKF